MTTIDGEPGNIGFEFKTGSPPGVRFAAGMAAGGVGLAVFLVLHAIWIVPIWFVAPIGLVIAVLGGAAINVAYLHVTPHLPRGYILRWLAVTGGAVSLLVPSLLVAWAGDPYFRIVDGVGVPTAEGSVLAIRFLIEFLVLTILVGGVAGWTVTRTRQGSVAVAVAAFALAIGPGHNLPFFHLPTAPTETRTGLLLTLIPVVVASAVFIAVDALLGRYENPA